MLEKDLTSLHAAMTMNNIKMLERDMTSLHSAYYKF